MPTYITLLRNTQQGIEKITDAGRCDDNIVRATDSAVGAILIRVGASPIVGAIV